MLGVFVRLRNPCRTIKASCVLLDIPAFDVYLEDLESSTLLQKRKSNVVILDAALNYLKQANELKKNA